MPARRIDQPPKPEEAQRLAMRAVFRGHASAGQQVIAGVFILEEVLGLTALPASGVSDFEAGFAAGKQWAGMVIANTAGLRLWTPETDEDNETNAQ